MSFNPDPNKQGGDLLFCRKINSDDHPKLTFNYNQVQQCSSQKHLGLFLDNELDFNKHLDEKILNCKNSPYRFPDKAYLLSIYKSIV